MTFLIRQLLIFLVFVLATPLMAADFPVVHPSEIVAKYGKPDRVESTEYDKPRPPFVTRMLIYKKEHVRFTFLPTAKIGTPPPYESWYLLGMQDPRDNSVISSEEAGQRMRRRLKQ